LRRRNALRAGHTARAADVLDNDLLFEKLSQTLRDDAPHDIGRTTSRKRHRHRDRPARPRFGTRKSNAKNYKSSYREHCRERGKRDVQTNDRTRGSKTHGAQTHDPSCNDAIGRIGASATTPRKLAR
jgi:hypothetical protein